MNSKSIGIGAGAIVVVLGLFWWAIGPDWRAVLSDPPRSADIFELRTEQRPLAFRMADRVPFVAKSRPVAAGDNVRVLEQGDDLDIDMDVDALLEKHQTSGLVIVHNGKIRMERYRLGFGPGKRFFSFSVGKSFAATLVGVAIQDGYISSVDQLVTDFIPEFKGSAYDGVTIDQILSMTTGVKWDEDYSDPESDIRRMGNHVADEGSNIPNIVDFMSQLPRAHPPGEQYKYNSGETSLIAVMLQRAIDRPLAYYLSEKIWKPFGMEDDARWFLSKDGVEIGSGALMVTARDYARFGLFALEQLKGIGTPIVSSEFMKQATSFQAVSGYQWDYGYQWWIGKPDAFPGGAFLADGIYGQGIFVDPSRDLIIVTNNSWTTPGGGKNNEFAERDVFFKAVQAAIDKENSGAS
ncbi:MAG: serine hydrolase domain-containing protein [Pseudomonadota bacterium]